jgi:hypothetical protein
MWNWLTRALLRAYMTILAFGAIAEVVQTIAELTRRH